MKVNQICFIYLLILTLYSVVSRRNISDELINNCDFYSKDLEQIVKSEDSVDKIDKVKCFSSFERFDLSKFSNLQTIEFFSLNHHPKEIKEIDFSHIKVTKKLKYLTI